MSQSPSISQRSIRMPTQALAAIRDAVQDEAGPLATVRALQAAGYRTGESLYDELERALGRAPDDLGEDAFFQSLSEFMRARGWGSLRREQSHDGVGLLVSEDWCEADGGRDDQPSCSFSAGLLSGLLSRAAGAPVAVLQVSCRGSGDDRCGFAFGSGATVHGLYSRMLEGEDVDAALAAL